MASLEDITRQALGLGLQDRSKLTETLLDSLEELSEAEIEELWLDEAERRIQRYREGRDQGVPAEQIFQEAEDLLG